MLKHYPQSIQKWKRKTLQQTREIMLSFILQIYEAKSQFPIIFNLERLECDFSNAVRVDNLE